ncbi:MAG: hypothetical protein C0596_09525 [Marinilabiliales bacterium]|nr:MAG: hypothetical protein C0596_09525 [Marinilabiliales bacterium]
MNKKHYQRTDVSIVREILKVTAFCDSKTINQKMVLGFIQQINKVEICLDGFENELQQKIKQLNFAEFGIKSVKDANVTIVQNVFKQCEMMLIIPKRIYELSEKIEFPIPVTKIDRMFLSFIGDLYERLKIKAENVINETASSKDIELYARKNIQLLQRIFLEARNEMKEVCVNGESFKFFRIYVFNVLIYHLILFYQNMFSGFFIEEKQTKSQLRHDLYNSIEFNNLMEPFSNYNSIKKPESDDEIGTFVWKGKKNVLATLFYDLRQENLLEVKNIDICLLLNKYFVDDKGIPISIATIETCLKDYRPDKRSKGNDRIDTDKYS